MVPYVKGNLQLFNPDEGLAQAKDVILHEGRYFLVQDPAGIDKENLSKIVESFPPPVLSSVTADKCNSLIHRGLFQL